MAEKVLFQISLNEDEGSIRVKSNISTVPETCALSQALVGLYKELSSLDDFMKLVEMDSEEEMVEEVLKQTLTKNNVPMIKVKSTINN